MFSLGDILSCKCIDSLIVRYFLKTESVSSGKCSGECTFHLLKVKIIES